MDRPIVKIPTGQKSLHHRSQKKIEGRKIQISKETSLENTLEEMVHISISYVQRFFNNNV
jgi:hypothetical protein